MNNRNNGLNYESLVFAIEEDRQAALNCSIRSDSTSFVVSGVLPLQYPSGEGHEIRF
jgi:hypothetical protein